MASQPCGCAGGAARQGGHRSGVPPEGRLRGAGEPVDTTPWGAALAGTAVVGAACACGPKVVTPRSGLRPDDDHSAEQGRESAGGPSSPARPRCVRMRRTTRGSSIVAITRMRPPHFGQASTSTAKTLWSSSAQRQRRGAAGLEGGSSSCGGTPPVPRVAAVSTSAAAPGPAVTCCLAPSDLATAVVAASAARPAIDAGVAAASARP